MISIQKLHLNRIILIAAVCAVLLCFAGSAPALAQDDDNLFDRNDPYFAEGYNYIQSTSELTAEPSSFITGYIPVSPGDAVTVNLNSTVNSDFIKYALFDTDKNWIDTVKTNNISELTVRIFEPGFIRVSVYGRQFEDTITIYIGADRQVSDEEFTGTLLTSPTHTNILVKTTEEDRSDYWIDRFDRADPDFLDKHNFLQFTNQVVEEYNSFITGYIQVEKGDSVIMSLNSDSSSNFIKYALYDSNKVWQKTARHNHVSDVVVTITDPGYIRFSVNGRLFKNTATVFVRPATKLSSDQQIDDVILPAIADSVGHQESFEQTYLSEEVIDLFNKNDPDFMINKGYRQLTDEIVDDEGSFMSGYIPVVSGQVVIVTISEDSEFAKYVLFDSNKQWLSTTRINNPTVLVVPITETGYFRFHGTGKALDATTITIPSVKKLDINAVSGNIGKRLERLESDANIVNQIDVLLFMGQSNMAGRGIVTDEFPTDAPAVIDGAGWEFKSISDPTKLNVIDKYFGIDENVAGAIDDTGNKTGGLVPSFVNAYYQNNGHVPSVCVSASEGSTSISDWQPGTEKLTDAIVRLDTCVNWLKANGYEIRHQYVIWCQGEHDDSEPEEWYTEQFSSMLGELMNAGIEKCFMIRVGNSNPQRQSRIDMMACQNHICQYSNDVIMVSTDLAAMLDKGLMKDDEHYYQCAYNECGEHAGINMAYYVNTGKEPMMYDAQFDELYMTRTN